MKYVDKVTKLFVSKYSSCYLTNLGKIAVISIVICLIFVACILAVYFGKPFKIRIVTIEPTCEVETVSCDQRFKCNLEIYN